MRSFFVIHVWVAQCKEIAVPLISPPLKAKVTQGWDNVAGQYEDHHVQFSLSNSSEKNKELEDKLDTD